MLVVLERCRALVKVDLNTKDVMVCFAYGSAESERRTVYRRSLTLLHSADAILSVMSERRGTKRRITTRSKFGQLTQCWRPLTSSVKGWHHSETLF
jgi:hypothetical protein